MQKNCIYTETFQCRILCVYHFQFITKNAKSVDLFEYMSKLMLCNVVDCCNKSREVIPIFNHLINEKAKYDGDGRLLHTFLSSVNKHRLYYHKFRRILKHCFRI